MNKNLTKLIILFLIINLSFIGSFINKSYAQNDIKNRLNNNTTAYLMGSPDTGNIFLSESADKPMELASTSKVMTYILVRDKIESGDISYDDKVTISQNAADTPGSSLDLETNEILSVEQLINGLMIISANDGAVALAEYIAGSEAEFAKLMNEKAENIGITTAKFLNSSGLPSENGAQNKMSTKDIFKMASYVITTYPEVLNYGKIPFYEMPERDYKEDATLLPLQNIVNGIDGLKTGYTHDAGYCIVSTIAIDNSAAPVDNKIPRDEEFRIIGIIMGSTSIEARAELSKNLIEYAKNNLYIEKFADTNEVIETKENPNDKNLNIDLYPMKNSILLTSLDTRISLNSDVDEIILPLKEGQTVGTMNVYSNGELIDNFDLQVRQDYIKHFSFESIKNIYNNVLDYMKYCYQNS